MTRELKFRVREINEDATYNHMVSDRVTIARVVGDYIRKNKTSQSGRQPHFSDSKQSYEIMQFTGLYDKNNQQIYEGDILKFHNGFCEDIAGIVWYNTGGRGLKDCELFLHELFIWKDESNKELGKYIDVEVLGNVYEGI